MFIHATGLAAVVALGVMLGAGCAEHRSVAWYDLRDLASRPELRTTDVPAVVDRQWPFLAETGLLEEAEQWLRGCDRKGMVVSFSSPPLKNGRLAYAFPELNPTIEPATDFAVFALGISPEEVRVFGNTEVPLLGVFDVCQSRFVIHKGRGVYKVRVGRGSLSDEQRSHVSSLLADVFAKGPAYGEGDGWFQRLTVIRLHEEEGTLTHVIYAPSCDKNADRLLALEPDLRSVLGPIDKKILDLDRLLYASVFLLNSSYGVAPSDQLVPMRWTDSCPE